MTVYIGSHKVDVEALYLGLVEVASLYLSNHQIWSKNSTPSEASLSCFGNGYWIDDYPWVDEISWTD